MSSMLLLTLLILVIAYLYSSVGHGGASGYLALMALFGISPSMLRSSALTLNILVSLLAFFYFYKGNYFRLKLFLPFALVSVPMAFLGASFEISPVWYKKLLAVFLVIAVIRLFFRPNNKRSKKLNVLLAVIIGAILGFISGIIGIGGGIILTPVILLLGWGNVKETAAVSALFIFVNSLAGLFSLYTNDLLKLSPYIHYWIVGAFLGALLGGYAGAFQFDKLILRRVLAVVLSFATFKLLVI